MRRFQDVNLQRIGPMVRGHRERVHVADVHLALGECGHLGDREAAPVVPVVHGDDHARDQGADDRIRLRGIDRVGAADRNEQDIHVANEGAGLIIQHVPQITQVDDGNAVHDDPEDEIAASILASVRIVKRGNAGDRHVLMPMLSGRTHEHWIAGDLVVVMIAVAMRDRDDVGGLGYRLVGER